MMPKSFKHAYPRFTELVLEAVPVGDQFGMAQIRTMQFKGILKHGEPRREVEREKERKREREGEGGEEKGGSNSALY